MKKLMQKQIEYCGYRFLISVQMNYEKDGMHEIKINGLSEIKFKNISNANNFYKRSVVNNHNILHTINIFELEAKEYVDKRECRSKEEILLESIGFNQFK